MIRKGLQQCYGIVIKNLLNHWANKKKFFGEFIFPFFISGLYILMQSIFVMINYRPKRVKSLDFDNFRGAPQTVNIDDLPVSYKVAGHTVFEREVKKVSTVPDDIWTRVQGAYIEQPLLHGALHVVFSCAFLHHAQLL